MPINILMPALSPTMEKGNLAKWLKKEGDRVAPGEGTADVPVNQLIAVLAGEGEDVKATAAAAGKDGGGARPPAPPPPQKPSAAAPSPQRGEGAAPAPAARPGPPPAPQAPVTSPQRADVAARSVAGEGIRTNGGGRIFASPLARRLAKEAGIDVARVQGSGPHGRVIARDIAAPREGRGLAPAPAAAAP